MHLIFAWILLSNNCTFLIIEKSFRGDLTDVSAKTKILRLMVLEFKNQAWILLKRNATQSTQRIAVPCHVMPCNAVQCRAMPCNAMQALYTIEMQDPVMREFSIWSMMRSHCDESHSYFCSKFWVNIAQGINYHKDRDCLFNNAVRNSCPLLLCSTPQQLQIIGYQATRVIPLLQKSEPT